MEVFAGFLEHADAQIGRVLDYLEKIGVLDNTIVVLLSDNGTSAEGGQNGRINQEKSLSILEENNNVELTLPYLQELGSSVYSNPHYPVGWANAGNTPFQWYKSWVHSGGVKDPLIISYPNGIKAKGEIRSQYLHVVDIAPTILDILGVKKPEHIKGISQRDYHGVSFQYTFDDANAANRKHTQYYEQTGNRGIWHDGWKAITNHIHTDDFINEDWELYHTEVDFSESENVADKYPDKLRELIALWYAEAGKYGVLPLGDAPYLTKTSEQLATSEFSNNFYIKPQKFEYKGVLYPLDITPKTLFKKRNHKISIVTTHKAENEGILYSAGNRFGGYVLFIKKNRLHYVYNYHGEQVFRAVSADVLPEGRIRVGVQFIINESGTATVKLFVNGKLEGETEITGFIFMMETHASLKDGGSSAVTDDYTLPFEYPAELEKVTIEAASYLVDKNELMEEFFAID